MSYFPNQAEAAKTINGLIYGEPVGYSGPRFQHCAKNPKWSPQSEEEIAKTIFKRVVVEGSCIGPFNVIATAYFRASPLFTVPKDKSKLRVIHNLSSPQGRSINTFIDKRFFNMMCVRIESAIAAVLRVGKGALMFKRDWHQAYRNIHIWPGDFELCGFEFRRQYFMDTRLAFGLSSSAYIFCRYSDQAEWIFVNLYDLPYTAHYFDDHFFACFPDGEGPLKYQRSQVEPRANKAFSDLGIPRQEDKEKPPSTVMDYVGYELDSEHMCVRLSSVKLQRVLDAVEHLLREGMVEVKSVEETNGLLNWVTVVVRPGRPFVARLYRLIGYAKNKSLTRMRMEGETRLDLLWWKRFLPQYNGRSFFLEQEWSEAEQMDLEVDASGWGAGGFWGRRWFSYQFKPEWARKSIAVREMIALFLACKAWDHLWTKKKITFKSDNTAVVFSINKMRAKNELLLKFIRELNLLQALHNFEVRVRWIPGADNRLADHLSRNRITEFKREFNERFREEPRLLASSVKLPCFTKDL